MVVKFADQWPVKDRESYILVYKGKVRRVTIEKATVRYLRCFDKDKGAYRTFSAKHTTDVRVM